MKRNLLGLFAVVLAIAFSAFAKPYASNTYMYLPSDNVIGSMSSANLDVATNWDDGVTPPTFSNNTRLAAITFNEEFVADGPSDGALTIAEAIAAVKNQYVTVTPNSLPADNASFAVGASSITVRRKL